MTKSSLKVEALTAYLQPLLDKHEKGQELIHEDLVASWHAVDNLLSSSTSDSKAPDVSAVKDEMLALHKSQLAAYRDNAIASLQEWAESWALPKITIDFEHMEGGDAAAAVEAYRQLCLTESAKQRPAWKVGTGLLEKTVNKIIRERAAKAVASAKQKLLEQQQQQIEKKRTAAEAATVEDSSSSQAAAAGRDAAPPAKKMKQLQEKETDDEEGEIDEDDEKHDASAENKGDHDDDNGEGDEEEDGEVDEDTHDEGTTTSATETAGETSAKGRVGVVQRSTATRRMVTRKTKQQQGGQAQPPTQKRKIASKSVKKGTGRATRGRGGAK